MSDSAPQPSDDTAAETGAFWRWAGTGPARRTLGWIFIAGGALCILAGYLGISRQALVAKQLPYLISGGISGLALVGVGTFYLATEQLRRDSGRLDRLEEMVAQLHGVLLSRPDAPAWSGPSSNGPEPAQAAAGDTERVRLVALPEGRRYHRSECSMVADKENAATVSETAIRQRQLDPCDLCEPPTVAVMATASGARAR
jgi:hypothetical protein